MQHNGVDRESLSIQDRLQAMNKFDEREERKLPFSVASNNTNSPEMNADSISPEEQLATEEKSYPKRSSVIDLWRKREASIKPVNNQKPSFKFEEKKEVHEDESERDSAPEEKRSTLYPDARTVTPERSGPELSFSNASTPASSDDAVISGPRRSSVRDSWKKRSPNIPPALPLSSPSKASTFSNTSEVHFTPTSRSTQSPSRFRDEADAGDNETTAVPDKSNANKSPAQSGWRKMDTVVSPRTAYISEPQAQEAKERIDGNIALNGIRSNRSIVAIERTNSIGSINSGSGENHSSNNSTGSNFDELRSKWAKFGIEQRQHGTTRDGSSKVPPSSPIPSSPRLYVSTPKMADSPRVGMWNLDDANPGLDSKPQLQIPDSADPTGTSVSTKSPGLPLPKKTPFTPEPQVTPKAEESKPSIKKHFVKLGQLHASRPKVDSPGRHSPNSQQLSTMPGEIFYHQQSPNPWSLDWPGDDSVPDNADQSKGKSMESTATPKNQNSNHLESTDGPLDVPSTRLSFRRMNETRSLRAKHRLRSVEKSIETNQSGDAVVLSQRRVNTSVVSNTMTPPSVQPMDTFVPSLRESDGTGFLDSSDDYTTAGSDASRGRSTKPGASKDSLQDLGTTGDSNIVRERTGQSGDDMLRSSLPMQTLFGALSEENASADDMSRSMLFSKPAHPEFSLAVSKSNSFPDTRHEQTAENLTSDLSKSFDSWNGNPTFSKDKVVASNQNLQANSSIATSLTSRASKRLRDRRQRPTGSEDDQFIQQRNEENDTTPVPQPSALSGLQMAPNRETTPHPSNSFAPPVPHRSSLPRNSRPMSYKTPPSNAKNRLDPPEFHNPPPVAQNGSYASVSLDESTARSQSLCSETTGTYSNSHMHSTHASGFANDVNVRRQRANKKTHRPSLPAVPRANEMVPDEFVSEKNASVESFKIAYERMSLEQIANDIRDEASSVLNMDFLNKGMFAAGESINKIVGGEIFQKSSPKKLHRRAPSPVEEVAIEVEYVADSDDEAGR